MSYCSEVKIYVQVSFAEKDEVKKRGARWNPQNKLWYFRYYTNEAGELNEDDAPFHTGGFPIKDVTFGSDELDAKHNYQVREIYNIFRAGNIKYKSHLEKMRKKTV